MPFFPRRSDPSCELHGVGGRVLIGKLDDWERELHYLRFRIAEWKQFASTEHEEFYEFRQFLFRKITEHMYFELKTLSSILVACEAAIHSADVPPLMKYHQMFFVFRERISTGEVTRRMHMEEWNRYTSDTLLSPSYSSCTSFSSTVALRDSDAMFERLRAEIAQLEQRSADFKRILGELRALVEKVKEMDRAAAARRAAAAAGTLSDRREEASAGSAMDVVDEKLEEGKVRTQQKRKPKLLFSPTKSTTHVPTAPYRSPSEQISRIAALRSRFGL